MRLRVESLELLESLIDRLLRATRETKELMLLVFIIILDGIFLDLVSQFFLLLLAPWIHRRLSLSLE